MTKYAFFITILCLMVGCNKPDPAPENSDDIYKDLQSELDIATKGLEAETKNLAKVEDEKKKVVPQTGQIKFAEKKIYETRATLNKLQQQKQFFEIKIELRKAEVRRRYLEARGGGRKWPDQNETELYKAAIKFQREKLEWDKNKGTKKDVPHGTSAKPGEAASEHH